MEYAEGLGIKALLVDAHNSLSKPHAAKFTEDGTEMAERIASGCRKALKAVLSARTGVEMSWARREVSTIPPYEGMGRLGVFVILVREKDSGRRFAYIVLDSNNLKSGMREKIVESLRERGLIDDGEVLTTDTHYVNAYFPRSAYVLLDESKLPEILKAAEDAIRECEGRLSDVTADGEVIMEEVRVMGSDKITKLVAASTALSTIYPLLLGFVLGILFLVPSLIFVVSAIL